MPKDVKKNQTFYITSYNLEDTSYPSLAVVKKMANEGNLDRDDFIYEVKITRKLQIVADYQLKEIK